jgi:hypothetical protein
MMRALVVVVMVACGSAVPAPSVSVSVSASASASVSASASAAPSPPPALPLERIAILGASVSSGFGGTPFAELFTAAAPRAQVTNAANLALFRDPIGDTVRQVGLALDAHATTVIALDLLFWDVYGPADPTWRADALRQAFAQLDRIAATGAWILVGDLPQITTASELFLPRASLPSSDALAAANTQLAAWAATRPHVRVIPLAVWSAPLHSDGTVELAPGERVPASSLMALDGLHVNTLGDWYLLTRLVDYIAHELPGTPADALVFARPPP